MRIVMLAWEFPPRIVGGLAMHVYDLSTTLASLGHDVTVITCNNHSSPSEEKMDGVNVLRVNPYELPSRDIVSWAMQLNVAMLEKAVQVINRDGPFDIVHAHDWLTAYAGRALKHSYQLPLIVTIHATEHGRNNGIHNEIQHNISNIEWWLTYEAWKVICCSDYMVGEVRRVFNLPHDKVVHIPNGVHPARIRNRQMPEGFKERFALPWERIIYYVGRLVQEKGVQVLIDSAYKVLAHVPEAKFIIAGTGPFESHLRAKARDLGLGDKMLFTGYINDEDRDMLYLAADAAVFPSLYEPFGIVALEAMAAGTPAIVSDSGGLAEIVKNNVDGLWAMTGSANSLADRIIEVLTNDVMARKLVDNAYSKVKNLYDWKIIARHTLDIYRSVAKDSKAAGRGQERGGTLFQFNRRQRSQELVK
ncbi:MAG: glycosyltransferase family 4 protein [Acidobacteriota bacterium]